MFSLGVSLTNLARTIPHGMLIFFPSYTVMNSLVEHWKSNGIYENLNSMKVKEPKFVFIFSNNNDVLFNYKNIFQKCISNKNNVYKAKNLGLAGKS